MAQLLRMTLFCLAFLALCFLNIQVDGHAYLAKPKPRSWIINNCGNRGDGVGICQKSIPGTDCGVCGDNLKLEKPRPHENGGKYGKAGTEAVYTEGQLINVTVVVTNPHKGFIQWRICKSVLNESDNQSCFNENLLQVMSARTENMTLIDLQKNQIDIKTYYRPNNKNMLIEAQLALPENLICDHCVMQMNYRAGRTWKKYSAAQIAQETFRSCSDVRIVSESQVEFLQSFGLKLCLVPRPNTNHSLQFLPCDQLEDSQGVISTQTWPEFEIRNNSIKFVLNGHCLDVQGDSQQLGANIIHWPCLAQSNQKWSINRKTATPDEFQVKSQRSGLCLSASAKDKQNLESVTQRTCDENDDNQYWRVVTSQEEIEPEIAADFP